MLHAKWQSHRIRLHRKALKTTPGCFPKPFLLISIQKLSVRLRDDWAVFRTVGSVTCTVSLLQGGEHSLFGMCWVLTAQDRDRAGKRHAKSLVKNLTLASAEAGRDVSVAWINFWSNFSWVIWVSPGRCQNRRVDSEHVTTLCKTVWKQVVERHH